LSEIRATTISDAAGTGPIDLHKQSAAKAHANLSSSFVIQGSLNIASTVDNGAGDCSVNFTNAMSDTSYTIQANSANSLTMAVGFFVSASQYRMRMFNTSGAYSDRATMSSTHGDLA
jgi:hypothetical protein